MVEIVIKLRNLRFVRYPKETKSKDSVSGLEEKKPKNLGRLKPQNWKAKKERGDGKATNLGGFGLVKPQNQEANKARGLGRQPTGGNLGRVKPQKPKAKKERGVEKATNLGGGGFGVGKTLKPKKAQRVGGQLTGGIWGGYYPKTVNRSPRVISKINF